MAWQPQSMDPADRIARLLDLQVRLKLSEMGKDRSQTEMIMLLGQIGVSSAEISDLLGVSGTTVRPILSRARKAPRQRPRGSSRSRK